MKDKINEIKELLKCLSGEKPCTNCYLTDKAHEEGTSCINLIAEMTLDLLNEIQDKIENGTLIEIDIWDKDILEDYAHKMFDSWNDITGAIHECSSWYSEVLSVLDDIVGMVYGITKRKAEAEQKLKELEEQL